MEVMRADARAVHRSHARLMDTWSLFRQQVAETYTLGAEEGTRHKRHTAGDEEVYITSPHVHSTEHGMWTAVQHVPI